MIAPPQASGGLSDVQARVTAIQTRLQTLSPQPAQGFGPALANATGQTPGIPGPPPTGTTGPTGAPAAPAAAGAPASGGARATEASSAPPASGSDAAAATRASGAWAQKLPAAGQQWAGHIETAATEAGIDPALLAALVRHESNFDQNVTSHAGAIGLAQLMPGTARGLGVDPHDPMDNLRGGARYLKTQLDRFGSPELALAAYNAGPNRVAQAGGIPRIAETQAYVPRVINTWEQWR